MPCVGLGAICLKGCCDSCVRKTVNGGWRRGRNRGSVGGACRQDDSMGRWRKTVPSLCLFFRLALCSEDGVERFRVFQPCGEVAQDSRETRVVLWCSLGWIRKVLSQPPAEPDARAFSTCRYIGVAMTRDDFTYTA